MQHSVLEPMAVRHVHIAQLVQIVQAHDPEVAHPTPLQVVLLVSRP